MTLFGHAALLALLPGPPPLAKWPRFAAPAAACFALLWFALTAQQMAGASTPLDPGLWRTVLSQSLFGEVFAVRFAFLILLCLGLWLRWRQSFLAFLSGAALALIAVTSHAAGASPANFTAIGITSDGLHLLTAGFWLGGLTVLAPLFAGPRERLAPAIRLFSEWAMIAVAVLILTGMLNAASILLGGEGHDSRLYLGLLALKLAGVAVMLGLALFNQWRLLPNLPQEQAAARLSVHIGWELKLGGLVVLLAIALTLLQPTI